MNSDEAEIPLRWEVSIHITPQISSAISLPHLFSLVLLSGAHLAFGEEFGLCDFRTMRRFPARVVCAFRMLCPTCLEVSKGTCYYKIPIYINK